jgi:hypothetical protein
MTTSKQREKQTQESEFRTAIYVYGIVPGDVQVEQDAQGVGDPPAPVDVVREGDIAALVSPVPADRALGTPKDLQAHAKLLDGTAGVAPVLPLRFGAVMTDAEAVAEELLHEHHDEFAQALNALEGHAEYIVKGRYEPEAFLKELLSKSEQAQALRDQIRSTPEAASRDTRMALGELIAKAIEERRTVDTQAVVDELGAVVTQVNVREPTHEWDAVNLAVLVEVDRQAGLERVLERLRESLQDRLKLRLQGPLAAYDFVVAARPEG